MAVFHDRGGGCGNQNHGHFFLGRAHLARFFKGRSTQIRHFLSGAVNALAIGMVPAPFAGPLVALVGKPAKLPLARHATRNRAIGLAVVALPTEIKDMAAMTTAGFT